jgi:hypothetical protein
MHICSLLKLGRRLMIQPSRYERDYSQELLLKRYVCRHIFHYTSVSEESHVPDDRKGQFPYNNGRCFSYKSVCMKDLACYLF